MKTQDGMEKQQRKYKWVIRVYSKHSPDYHCLGIAYDSFEAADKAAKQQVCARCWRYEIGTVPEDYRYVGARDGFASPEREHARRVGTTLIKTEQRGTTFKNRTK